MDISAASSWLQSTREKRSGDCEGERS